MEEQLPPAGWYPDPASPDAQRYWDGQAWTSHTHSATASKGNVPREKAIVVKSLPPSQWSRQQRTHVLIAIGLPLLLLVGLIFVLVSGSAEEESASVATTHSEQTNPEPDEDGVVATSLTTIAPTTTRRSSTTTSPPPVDPTRVEAGTYAVPTEIAPGTYRVSIHWARLDENRDVIDNDLTISGVSIMTVYPSDSFIELSGTAMPVDLLPTIDPIASGYNQGTYLVGPDIQPGTYGVTAQPGATAYVARLGEDLSIIGTDQNDDRVTVEVLPGDFALRYTGTLERLD